MQVWFFLCYWSKMWEHRFPAPERSNHSHSMSEDEMSFYPKFWQPSYLTHLDYQKKWWVGRQNLFCQNPDISVFEGKILECVACYVWDTQRSSSGWSRKFATRVFEIMKNTLSELNDINRNKWKDSTYSKKYWMVNDWFVNELWHA